MAWFGCLAMVHVETYVTILGGMNHKQLELGRQGDWALTLGLFWVANQIPDDHDVSTSAGVGMPAACAQ